MLPRTLEPEVMDSAEEAADYDAMDHAEVNCVFARDCLEAWRTVLREAGRVDAAAPVWLDVGTGTALIPIELCRQCESLRILGIDLAQEMLRRGVDNVRRAKCLARISLARMDAKRMPFPDGLFCGVISNSIVHHIPDPLDVLREMTRVLAPGGMLFVRDLARPATAAEVERIVRQYAGGESPRQQQLFRQSLHAALTAEETAHLAVALGWPPECVQKTSDRHWTLRGRKSRP
jgi:ubiquinone/menaquinone biosynthesis C-methylase UbiE